MRRLQLLTIAMSGVLCIAVMTDARGARVLSIPAHKTFSNVCAQKHAYRTDHTFGSVTVDFPQDCGVTGSVTSPPYKEFGPSTSFGMVSRVCENDQPLVPQGHGCPHASWNPSGICQQAGSTFWYLMTTFKAILLQGHYGNPGVKFFSNTFPITFTSSTFIVPGNVYGLCVISTDGRLIQDDFVSGNTVKPSGNTISVNMVLTKRYIRFEYEESINVYFESAPSSMRLGHPLTM